MNSSFIAYERTFYFYYFLKLFSDTVVLFEKKIIKAFVSLSKVYFIYSSIY